MSFVLTVWPYAANTAAATDGASADALLERQQALRGTGQNPLFLVLGRLLHDRFPPVDDLSGHGVWVDGSEEGTCDDAVLTFAIDTRSRFFDAAYLYAVAQANSLGLNVYDLQSGEHHLAYGFRRFSMGAGAPPIREDSADAAWQSAWHIVWAEHRQAAVDGSPAARHDLGLCLRDGVPRQRLLACAVMQWAAAEDNVRRAQAQDTLALLPADLHTGIVALAERLRSSPDPLQLIEARIADTEAQRSREAKAFFVDAAFMKPAALLRMREMAEDGHRESAGRLAYALGPRDDDAPSLVPPWGAEPHLGRRFLELAARWGEYLAPLRMAERLLSGRDGGPIDVRDALAWLQRAKATDVLARLTERAAGGWNPIADRPRAEAALHEAERLDGNARIDALRRACELDHADGWRRLGDAYFHAESGLDADPVIGLALHFTAQKELSSSRGELGPWFPKAMKALPWTLEAVEDALRIGRALVGDARPWETIARCQDRLKNSESFVSYVANDGKGGVEVFGPNNPRPVFRQPVEPAELPASTASTAAPASYSSHASPVGRASTAPMPQRRSPSTPNEPNQGGPSTPLRAGLHVGHVTLLVGTLLPFVLLFSTRIGRPLATVGLVVCSLLALHGAWRCSRDLGWSSRWRTVVSMIAAVPGIGVVAAFDILRSKPERGSEGAR